MIALEGGDGLNRTKKLCRWCRFAELVVLVGGKRACKLTKQEVKADKNAADCNGFVWKNSITV